MKPQRQFGGFRGLIAFTYNEVSRGPTGMAAADSPENPGLTMYNSIRRGAILRVRVHTSVVSSALQGAGSEFGPIEIGAGATSHKDVG